MATLSAMSKSRYSVPFRRWPCIWFEAIQGLQKRKGSRTGFQGGNFCGSVPQIQSRRGRACHSYSRRKVPSGHGHRSAVKLREASARHSAGESPNHSDSVSVQGKFRSASAPCKRPGEELVSMPMHSRQSRNKPRTRSTRMSVCWEMLCMRRHAEDAVEAAWAIVDPILANPSRSQLDS